MIRIRIDKATSPEWLASEGYTETTDGIWTKTIGSLEVSVKLGYPSNLRIRDWSDNRAPWILFKFLLALEENQEGPGGKLKVTDQGQYRILVVQDVLDLIKELSHFTDLKKRLGTWYTGYLEGTLKV